MTKEEALEQLKLISQNTQKKQFSHFSYKTLYTIITDHPNLAQEVFNSFDITLKNSSNDKKSLSSAIIVLANIGTENNNLQNQCFDLITQANNIKIAKIWQNTNINIADLSDVELKMLKDALFSKQISSTEKEIFLNLGLKRIAQLDINQYIKTKDTLVDLIMAENKNPKTGVEEKIRTFEYAKLWLTPAILDFNATYGKNYQQYLTKVIQYNSSVNNQPSTQKHKLKVKDVLGWMENFSKVSDKENLRKFIDNNLLYNNQEGEQLCRLCAPKYDEEQQRITCTNEIEIVMNRWDSLNEEEKQKPFNEVFAICKSTLYQNQKDPKFAKEAAKWGVNDYNYPKYENIYLKSLETQSNFDTTKVWQADDIRIKIADKSDVRVGFAGHYTSSSQHFDGSESESAIDSIIGPNSGALIIEKYNPKNDSYDMIGASWIYESNRHFEDKKYKVLTLDSVKIKESTPKAEALLLKCVKDLQQSHGYYQVNIGSEDNNINVANFARDYEGSNWLPLNYEGYTNATIQRVIIKASPQDIKNVIVKPISDNFENIKKENVEKLNATPEKPNAFNAYIKKILQRQK